MPYPRRLISSRTSRLFRWQRKLFLTWRNPFRYSRGSGREINLAIGGAKALWRRKPLTSPHLQFGGASRSLSCSV